MPVWTSLGLFVVHRRLLTIILIGAALIAYGFSGETVGQAGTELQVHFLDSIKFISAGLVPVVGVLLILSLAPPLFMGRLLLAIAFLFILLLSALVTRQSLPGLLDHPELIVGTVTLGALTLLVPSIGRRQLILLLLLPLTIAPVSVIASIKMIRAGESLFFENRLAIIGLVLFGLTLMAPLFYRYCYFLVSGVSAKRATADTARIGMGTLILFLISYAVQIKAVTGAALTATIIFVPLLAAAVFFLSMASLSFLEQASALARKERGRHHLILQWWHALSLHLSPYAAGAMLSIISVTAFLIALWVPGEKIFLLPIPPLSILGISLLLLALLAFSFVSARVTGLVALVFVLTEIFLALLPWNGLATEAVIFARTILLCQLVGMASSWRVTLVRGELKRKQIGTALATGFFPFIASNGLVIIAAVGFASVMRFSSDGLGLYETLSTLSIRLFLQSLIGALIAPVCMVVLRRLQLL